MKRLQLKTIIQWNQQLIHMITASVYKRVFNISGVIHSDLLSLPDARILIVVNHTRKRDPFDILSVLPFSVFKKLTPIRFFTANRFFSQWIKKSIVTLLGCFRAYKTENVVSGLKGGLQFSDNGQTLCIFPQGRIHKNSKATNDLKEGVAYLVKKRQFLLLPVFIRFEGNKRSIIWGKPFTISRKELRMDFSTLTKHIFRHVSDLQGRAK